MIGLGRMGANMARRLMRGGHQCVVYDLNRKSVEELVAEGAVGAAENGYLHCGPVGSWLLDLAAMALAENPTLSRYTGYVHDSGDGRWTVMAAVEEAVSAEVLTSALYTRFRSRQEHTFGEKMLSAMRNKFGGHVERPSGG